MKGSENSADGLTSLGLNDRTILITGASSGVGRSLALLLAHHGANVVCCARRMSLLTSLVAKIAEDGGTALAVACDVAHADQIAAAFDAGEARFGPIDSLIVNAGFSVAGPAAGITEAALDTMLDVNLRGGFLTAREGGRRLIAHDLTFAPRRIVFIASIMGISPRPGAAIYAATKAGVLSMTKTLALEWARHNITVNAVCPGFMPTDIVDDWLQSSQGQRAVASWPRKRPMPVDSVHGPVLFLLSPQSGAMTGASLVVDEGQSLGGA